ncbi:MAG: glycosyltransferase family 9 protein [Sulfurimicrobium sp.]
MKILVIRRDNIGDLVCTTPLIAALRHHFPAAEIRALVNSYNAAALENNPDIDAIHAYTKAKHRPSHQSVARAYWEQLKMFAGLRRQRFDYAILAGAPFLPRALKLARLIKPRHIVGFTEPGKRGTRHIDIAVPYGPPRPTHEVEDIFRLLAPLGIHGRPPQARIFATPSEADHAKSQVDAQAWQPASRLIGVHISARKPSQRWPAESFAELIRQLHRTQAASFLLFWSPGESGNPHHPGDDAKAEAVMQALPGIPILACPTRELGQLIGGLSLCDAVICSDGGAMHLAAGLGKPILCFFGKSDAARWRPWGVPHRVLQPASQDVRDISVKDAMTAFAGLLGDVSSRAPEG